MTENPSQEVASDDLFDASVARRIRQITQQVLQDDTTLEEVEEEPDDA